MTGRGNVLDIRDLTVRYPAGRRDALRDVSLELAEGEVLSLAGRNGAGKSTLCLAAAGLLPRVVRADVRGSVASPRTAGLVLADPAAGLSGARASVREEVAFGLENLGVPRAAMDRRIDRALAALRIEPLADRPPETLSGGEQQRVSIAAALAMESPLLILDEATAELDRPTTIAFSGLLGELAGAGTSILAADHAPTVLRGADRMAVLDDGSIAVIGPPDSVADHPALAGQDVALAGWAPVREVPPAAVELRNVSYRYPGGIEALRDVRLAVPPGQAVAVVGGNGSGKSTLAKHLVGLLRPTSGTVVVDGRDIAATGTDGLARTVGFLAQDARDQLFGRTVDQVVAFGPRNLRLRESAVAALVDAALAATGLTERRGLNPHDLDFAARKQAALAGVLAMEPAVVVLDEPTTGQDLPGLARVEVVLHALRAAGRTVIAITHDLELAARVFDRVVVMRDGEVVHDGPPAGVVERGSV